MKLFKWVEVYFGSNMDEYFRIQNVLRENAVAFKTRTDDYRGRMAADVLTGGNAAAVNNAGLRNQYTILVKEEDERRARGLIGG